MRARRGWEEEEKLDHIALTALLSSIGSASNAYEKKGKINILLHPAKAQWSQRSHYRRREGGGRDSCQAL